MKKAEYIIGKLIALILVIGILASSTAGIGESERMTYEQIKDIIFNTMVDGERVFKYPQDLEFFRVRDMQFSCKGAVLLTIPEVKEGKLEISSLFFLFDKAEDPDKNSGYTTVTMWEVESNQQENVLDLVGKSLIEYIDFDNGGKLTFCMTQHLDKETQILYEYSPNIKEFSDKDIYKTQNYAVYDSYEEFRDKVYETLFSANNGEISASKEDAEAAADNNTLQKGSKGDAVVKLQNRLNELGYSVGKADGDFGNKTKTAIEQFQADNGLDVTGIADEKTLELLYSDDAVSKRVTNDDAPASDKGGNADKASLIVAGMKYISSAVMDIAPALLSVPEDQCRITEIYYLDKGDNKYQFTARVSRGGSGGFGIGKDLSITPASGESFDIVDHNHVTLYSGTDKIPGDLIFGDADEASIARGIQILGNELKNLDVNGDGELSIDEIFEMD